MNRKNLLLATVAVGSAFALGCGPISGTPDAGDPDLVCEPGRPTVTTAQLQTLAIEPGCDHCHFTGTPQNPNNTGAPGDYTTAAKTQAALVNVISAYDINNKGLKMVDPGHLANSTMWLKIMGGTTIGGGKRGPNKEPVGGPMPNDATVFTADQKQAVRDWICSGATP
jgi:hypothetical protein